MARPEIQLTVPDSQLSVEKGKSVQFRCEYSGVNIKNKLVVRWRKGLETIWIYDSTKDTDKGDDAKYHRVQTNIEKSHVIELLSAEVGDEGMYGCKVELYTPYDDKRVNFNLTVLGKPTENNKKK